MGSIGKCPQCPPGSRDVLLIGGKCQAHFKNPGEQVQRAAEPARAKAIVQAIVKKSLKEWYAWQIKQMPARCENCKKKITFPEHMTKRAAIAHIVPKASIKSVATHDLNRWFACWQCHSDYDQHPAEKVAQMPIIKACRARFNEFQHLIPDSERRYIPSYLK